MRESSWIALQKSVLETVKMIAVVSLRSEVKLLVAFASFLFSLSLPLAGCGPLNEAKMAEGKGAQESSFPSVGPTEPILVPERKPYSWHDGTMGLLKETEGLLVKPGSSEELASGICKLLVDFEMRDNLGAASSRRIDQAMNRLQSVIVVRDASAHLSS